MLEYETKKDRVKDRPFVLCSQSAAVPPPTDVRTVVRKVPSSPLATTAPGAFNTLARLATTPPLTLYTVVYTNTIHQQQQQQVALDLARRHPSAGLAHAEPSPPQGLEAGATRPWLP